MPLLCRYPPPLTATPASCQEQLMFPPSDAAIHNHHKPDAQKDVGKIPKWTTGPRVSNLSQHCC